MIAAVAPQPQRRFQIDALDGVRGLAVLIVFLSHCSNKSVNLIPYADFSGIGKSGVWLFFLLSSFLLTYPFVAKGMPAFTAGSLGNYFWRRFLRVYPLYTLYLLVALATTPFVGRFIRQETPPETVTSKAADLNATQRQTAHREAAGREAVEGESPGPIGVPFALTPAEFLQHLVLLQGKGVTWSILVEFKFYFLLPLLALAYVKIFQRRLLPAALLTAACVALATWLWPDSRTNDPRLGPYLPIFLLGSFLALVHWHWQDQAWLKNVRSQVGFEAAGWIAILALILLIPSVASLLCGRNLPYNAFHRWFLPFCALWAAVFLATIYGSGRLRSIFAHPVLRFFGFISFSFYLIHVVVLNMMNKLFPELPLLGWWILAVTTAVSYVSYRLVEKPLAAVRLSSPRLKPMPVAESPA